MSSLTVWIVEVRRYGGQWTTLPSTSHAKQADAERAANRAVISGWDETRVREYVALEDAESRITEAVSTERERCEGVCWRWAEYLDAQGFDDMALGAEECAQAISQPPSTSAPGGCVARAGGGGG